MNVLFTTPTYYPFRGGAEACIEDLATRLVEAGHRISVVTSRYSDTLPRSEIRQGVSIVRIKYPEQSLNEPVRSVLCLLALGRLFRFLKHLRPDIVCIGLVGFDSFLVLLLHYLFNFKLIVYLHGGDLRSHVKVSPLIRWTLKHCLDRCYGAIAVSRELRAEAISFAPAVEDKVFVISNGVDIEAVRSEKAYRTARPYILFVGRLHPVKDIPTLIAAFDRISRDAPDLDLLIVGSGSLEKELKRLVDQRELSDRIVFLGDQPRSQVYALIKGSRFLVLPSESEGCPLVVLEALAAEKMTIASDVKGTSEIIRDKYNGALFRQGDPAELADLIVRYYRDDQGRRLLEETIRKSDLTRYDIRKTCEKHISIYRNN